MATRNGRAMDERSRNRRQWSDSALLSAIAARDGAAFAVFYRRHLPAVLAFLLRETRDSEAAADLAAEVFAAVLLSAGRYAERGESAAPWVIGVARNKVLMSFRRGRVEARARRRLGFQAVALDDGDLDRIEEVAQSDGGRLVALVDGLPEEERFAVRSRVLDERPYREIATELRCSELVIRKRVSRGLARMREQLKELGSA
jgi:RNA polymerase sigma-70 factor (ECF subfamily)